ncbi:MAG: hypothetical protein KDA61_02985 [Planctomycetales bacterium]|nr:hypothetical protein [Planctomycetales bacterium]
MKAERGTGELNTVKWELDVAFERLMMPDIFVREASSEVLRRRYGSAAVGEPFFSAR